MNTYAGIDLHSNNSYLVVMDEHEKLHFSKRIPNDIEHFIRILSEFKDSLTGLVIESTYNWYWLADGLMEQGYRVHLAMPSKIKQYSGKKYTNDKSDAVWLARLLKLGLVEGGYIIPPAMRSQRELTRKRMQMVQQQTQTTLSIQSMLVRYYNNKLSASKIRKLSTEALTRHCSDEHIAVCVSALHQALQSQMDAVLRLEVHIMKQYKQTADFKKLKAMPGIGDVLAVVIQSEVGEISRFKSAGCFASYCRLVNSERISNEKKKGANNAKNGNPYLCWAFIEATNAAIRAYEPISKFYQRKVSRKNPASARVAVAHKLARAVYYVLKNGEVFDMNKAF